MLITNGPENVPALHNVEIKYSPVVEIASSLHVLTDPARHQAHERWARETLANMTESMRSEFSYLSEKTSQWGFVMDLISYIEQHDIDSVESSLAHLGSIDRVEFVYGLYSGLLSKKTIRDLFADPTRDLGQEAEILGYFTSIDSIRDLIANEASFRKRLVGFLIEYWDRIFSETWNRIGLAEISITSKERSMLASMGAEAYLAACHPQIAIDETTIRVKDRIGLSYEKKDVDAVDVLISAYTNPNLMINCIDGKLTIYKGINLPGRSALEVPDELTRFLKSIGRPMKLKILSELNESPKTTKELAELFDVAPSSISEHLRSMREAELIYPQRIQNAVYYCFLHENYKAHASYLEHLFDPDGEA